MKEVLWGLGGDDETFLNLILLIKKISALEPDPESGL